MLLILTPGLALAADAQRITFVVAESFPLKEVSRENLVQVFLQKSTKIDRIDVDIIQYRTDSEERIAFVKNFLKLQPEEETLYWQQKLVSEGWRPPKTKVNSKVVLIYLLRNPNTIGYLLGLPKDLPQGLKTLQVK